MILSANRYSKRARIVQERKDTGVETSTDACNALIAKHDKHKNRCKDLIINIQCRPGLISEVGELHEKRTGLKKS